MTQRLPLVSLEVCQQLQLAILADHARTHSGYWREHLDAAGFGTDDQWFRNLPILTKAEVKAAGPSFLLDRVPMSHGRIHHLKTSGSTGVPLRIAKTELAQQFWKAITVRDSLWHKRDLRGKLAAIRVGLAAGRQPSWGPAYRGYITGPLVFFDARADINPQLDWLLTEQPDVLLTHPSNLAALVARSAERDCHFPKLCEVRTYSESVPEGLRHQVRETWGVSLTDIYSANEVGYLALQCPDTGLYHIQSEDVLVEIIDDDGRHCATGQCGRVIVTSLHNFAMPLFRYDIGDYAVAGRACSCGRTLPTVERILGRTRNMMRLPEGRTAWPGFPMDTLVKLTAISELKMIQHTLQELEILLVLARPLSQQEQEMLVDAVRVRLRHPFHIRLTPVLRIERGVSHKREDFECRVI
jgi:phenylacetate-CoA ligase